MTAPVPQGEALSNLSPYATWRTSPMGLAGRDPVFFAQLASETPTFHPERERFRNGKVSVCCPPNVSPRRAAHRLLRKHDISPCRTIKTI